MADYDSDSSAGGNDDIETNVLLGYASKEPTDDSFSQLGGHPTWFSDSNTTKPTSSPSGALAKCKVCNGYMNLLLQLHGDLPDRFPGHERRLYLMACKRKACRRKEGSVRGFRGTRVDPSAATKAAQVKTKDNEQNSQAQKLANQPSPTTNLGETLFGVKAPTTSNKANANPFAPPSSSNGSAGAPPLNPFAPTATDLAAKPAQQPKSTTEATDSLSLTFAEKARISSPPSASASTTSSQAPSAAAAAAEPWPPTSSFPPPYPLYHLDADKEFLEREDTSIPSNARVDGSEGGGSAADEKSAFESSMDKTFQRFADRLAQNPEQVLRYEFAGSPLLYSKNDAVGKMLAPMAAAGGEGPGVQHVRTAAVSNGVQKSGIPRCGNCGAERVFELQLTPHAIAELEADEMGLEGMDWGTVVLGVCARDCARKEKEGGGEVGYLEEWVGVQWEELVKSKAGGGK